MTARFQAFNESGTLQFSSELMTYYLKTKSTVTLNHDVSVDYDPELGGPAPGAAIYREPLVNFVNIASNEFVAYSCASPIFGAIGAPGSGQAVFHTHTSGAVMTYYIFAPFSGYTPTENVGLQLFNADGSLAFDASAGKPMVRTGRYPIGTMTPGMDVALGLPSGRTYAAYLSKANVRATSTFTGYDTGPPSFTWSAYNGCEAAFRMSSGDIRISESNNTAYTSGNQYDAYINVLDVTGY